MLLTYGIVGLVRYYGSITRIWPVAARFTLEEAQAYVKALEDQAKEFKTWRVQLQKFNPANVWDDHIESYIEKHMLDKHFESEAVYDIMCFKEDSAQ